MKNKIAVHAWSKMVSSYLREYGASLQAQHEIDYGEFTGSDHVAWEDADESAKFINVVADIFEITAKELVSSIFEAEAQQSFYEHDGYQTSTANHPQS